MMLKLIKNHVQHELRTLQVLHATAWYRLILRPAHGPKSSGIQIEFLQEVKPY